MINKIVATAELAVHGIADGSVILVSGFGGAGSPELLIGALIAQGARDLTVISNNVGDTGQALGALVAARRVRKFICSYPKSLGGSPFADIYRQRKIELELVPQGTLAERIRAGGAGIPAFFTPTSAGTELAANKEQRLFDHRPHVLEYAIKADYALIKAECADRWGNLTYRKAARNFGPIMATAAHTTISQVQRIVELGEIEAEAIVTPGIFVHRVVQMTPSHVLRDSPESVA